MKKMPTTTTMMTTTTTSTKWFHYLVILFVALLGYYLLSVPLSTTKDHSSSQQGGGNNNNGSSSSNRRHYYHYGHTVSNNSNSHNSSNNRNNNGTNIASVLSKDYSEYFNLLLIKKQESSMATNSSSKKGSGGSFDYPYLISLRTAYETKKEKLEKERKEIETTIKTHRKTMRIISDNGGDYNAIREFYTERDIIKKEKELEHLNEEYHNHLNLFGDALDSFNRLAINNLYRKVYPSDLSEYQELKTKLIASGRQLTR